MPTIDLRSCPEVNALLPNNRKVILTIAVGTFNKGMIGTPTFYSGVIEQQEELYLIRRLRDLPGLLRSSGSSVNRLGVDLPEADVSNVKVLNEAHTAHSSMLSGSGFSKSLTNEAPPPPPPQVAPQPSPAASQAEQQEASEGRNRTATNESPKALGTLTWGDAITKVQPQYPANAARVNASGPVDVKITISTTGRVIEAKALSGHL